MRTRPAVLMEPMSAGARSWEVVSNDCRNKEMGRVESVTNSRELQISPMKLLFVAILTASLTEMVVLPLLCTR